VVMLLGPGFLVRGAEPRGGK